MSEKHILLIGAGQLGSRHLQALALSKIDLKITVIDPSQNSLDVAKERFDQIDRTDYIKSIRYHQSISSAENIVDLCVLATNADCRLAVLKELVTHTSVKNIVFEKVLFQSSAQLDEAQNILSHKKINAWVNCPRRMQPIYHKLNNLLKNEEYIALDVKGKNWGLACNAIHMIDIWAYLSGCHEYTIDTKGLLPKLFDSKRANFKELSGVLKGISGKNQVVMSCDVDDGDISILHSIITPRFSIKIDEMNRKCEIKDLNDNSIEAFDFKILYQSKLTHLVVKSIIESGSCDLTTFRESAELHRPFLNSVLKFANEHGSKKYTLCPIT